MTIHFPVFCFSNSYKCFAVDSFGKIFIYFENSFSVMRCIYCKIFVIIPFYNVKIMLESYPISTGKIILIDTPDAGSHFRIPNFHILNGAIHLIFFIFYDTVIINGITGVT